MREGKRERRERERERGREREGGDKRTVLRIKRKEM